MNPAPIGPAASLRPVRLFYSYAPADEPLCRELMAHLANLRGQGLLHEWHVGCISPGGEPAAEVQRELSRADVVVLLLSADFMAAAGSYIADLDGLLARHQRGSVYVLPILIRPTDVAGSRFADLQLLPPGDRALTQWENRDEAWVSVVQGIRTVISPRMITAPMPRGEIRRLIGNHILCCEVFDFSNLAPTHQERCRRVFTEMVSALLRELHLKFNTDMLTTMTKAGMVVNFPNQPPDIHLRAAVTMAEYLHASFTSGFALRFGLNSYCDSLVVSENGQHGILGEGINDAQRVTSLAQQGQILMHDRVRQGLTGNTDFAEKLVYRGLYTVQGALVPVCQFVDRSCLYISQLLLPEPLASSASLGASVSLKAILTHRALENILTVELGREAQGNLAEIGEYIHDFLDSHEALQHLKVSVMWIANEMIENAFRYGRLGPDEQVILSLIRSKTGFLVEVEQPDVGGFEINAVFEEPEGRLSFIRMMHQRGLLWRQRRTGSRMTLSLELPRSVEIRPLAVPPSAPPNVDSLPMDLIDFVNGISDACLIDKILLIRVPWRRLVGTIADKFADMLCSRIKINRRIILDLRLVDYIGSVGLRTLMVAAKQTRGTPGAKLVVSSVSSTVREIFDISRFNFVVSSFADCAAAWQAMMQVPNQGS